MLKTCKTCGENKEESRFRKHRGSCKSCEKKKARARETPEKKRDYALRTKYGITLAQYEQMYSEQQGECYICSSDSKLFVDHCHETGQVRGLLCHHCNLVLGHAFDNPSILRLAATYLEQNDRSITEAESSRTSLE